MSNRPRALALCAVTAVGILGQAVGLRAQVPGSTWEFRSVESADLLFHGLAVVGLVLGYLNLVLSCLGILFFLLFFGSIIGLSGCAVLADAVSYVPANSVMPPLP